MCETERVFDMAYPNRGAIDQHADHIEPVIIRVPSVPIDPDHRGTLQLFAFPIVDRLHRSSEVWPFAGFNLDKCNHAIPLDDQVDVAVAAPEASLNHTPATPPKPPLRDSLSELPERLPGR
jgi:hypothetical protein